MSKGALILINRGWYAIHVNVDQEDRTNLLLGQSRFYTNDRETFHHTPEVWGHKVALQVIGYDESYRDYFVPEEGERTVEFHGTIFSPWVKEY